MLFGRHLNKHYLKYAIFFIVGLIALVAVDFIQLYVPDFLGAIVKAVQEGNFDLSIKGEDLQKVFYPEIFYFFRGFTNEEIESFRASSIGAYILGTVIVAVFMFIGRMVWRFAVFYAARKMQSDIRHDMFLKAEKLSQNYYHQNNVGKIMSWFTNDLDTLEEYMGWGFIMLVDSIFLSFFSITKMVFMDLYICNDYWLSILTAIPIILIIVWGALAEKLMSDKWEKRQKEFDNLYDYAQESFTGIRVIKAFVKERQEIRAFSKEALKNKDANMSFIKVAVAFDITIELLISVIVCMILLFGAYLVGAGRMGVDNLVTYIGYFDTLIWPMIALGQIVSMKSRAKASLKRIDEFLDAPEDVKDSSDATDEIEIKGKIEFKDFTFKFNDTKRNALSDINLTIEAGDTIGIVGKIGSGKTTLVNILLRIYNVDKGHLFIDDIDIMDIKLNKLRDAIAYVPQDNFLFSDSITNNIRFSNLGAEMDDVVRAAEFADVDSNIADFKEGYSTISGERGVTLSGGQKQRISIARAYLKNAPIMILDDSVSAVDVKTEETILKNIHEYRKGKTTILIASRVSTVQHMDKIIVLKDGCLEAFGPHDELIKSSPTYAKMVYLQTLEKEVEGGER